MRQITVYESNEIVNFEELKDILLNPEVGVSIDGIIYQDYEDILAAWDVDYTDSQVLDIEPSNELSRMAELCWNFIEEKYHFKD